MVVLRFSIVIKGVSLRQTLLQRDLQQQAFRLALDGRGRYLDNIFIERLWRSIKVRADLFEGI